MNGEAGGASAASAASSGARGGGRAAWDALDPAAQEALHQAWEAVRAGSIGVGAVVTDPDGRIVAAARNRVAERQAPPGEVAGSSLAHAEVNAIARLPFRSPRDLTLTTTLAPCVQCSAAVHMAPIASVRVLGADPVWDGCADLTSLNPWLGRRPPLPVTGPIGGVVGAFATLVARFGLGLVDVLAEALRGHGEGPLLELAADLQREGEVRRLVVGPVEGALEAWWDRLLGVAGPAGPAGPAG